MKSITFLLFLFCISSISVAQTLFIDYTERTAENTAAIHLMLADHKIESEEFTDIIDAKQMLVGIIESYRAAGYEVKSSNVSTHKHGRSYHYHYQYVLQTATPVDVNTDIPLPPAQLKKRKKQDQREGDAQNSDQQGMTPAGGGIQQKSSSRPNM
jgi:hypothetical protein